jgi:hypothetical protein
MKKLVILFTSGDFCDIIHHTICMEYESKEKFLFDLELALVPIIKKMNDPSAYMNMHYNDYVVQIGNKKFNARDHSYTKEVIPSGVKRKRVKDVKYETLYDPPDVYELDEWFEQEKNATVYV